MPADLHIEALAWLRYIKNMPLVCTEVGRWHADVLGVSSRYSIEVEVKKSISDLKVDFKKAKHWAYGHAGEDRWLQEVPNYLYYLVPENLKEKALPIIESHNPKYGLLWLSEDIFTRDTASLGYSVGKKLQVAKKAVKLHDNKPEESTTWTVIRRLSSELVGLYQSHLQLEASLLGTLKQVREDIRLAAAVTSASLPEPPNEYVELEGPK